MKTHWILFQLLVHIDKNGIQCGEVTGSVVESLGGSFIVFFTNFQCIFCVLQNKAFNEIWTFIAPSIFIACRDLKIGGYIDSFNHLAHSVSLWSTLLSYFYCNCGL